MPARVASRIVVSLCLLGGCAAQDPGSGGPIPAAYNVAWTTQGAGPLDAMPLGGGSIGLNVWTAGGEVVFEIGSPDAVDENGALLKLGRVRLRLDPNPLAEGGKFRQEFRPAESCVRISGAARGGKAEILLWVDVFHPVVHVEVDADRPVKVEAAFETWRHIARPIDWGNWKRHGTIDQAQRGGRFFIHPDTVAHEGRGVLWYHRNQADKDVRQALIEQQDMAKYEDAVPNPTRNLTFGGLLTGTGLVPAGTEETEDAGGIDCRQWKLCSAEPSRKHHVIAALRVAQDADVARWRAAVMRLAARAAEEAQEHRGRTLAWWRGFWNRSFIVINPSAGPKDPAWQVGRNYQLFRYMLGCNSSGRLPTKFNGGLVPIQHQRGAWPDFRIWGGAGMYIAQNQRHLYWPLLKSGDFDVMLPALNFYRDRAPLQQLRARHYWGIDGTPFPEAINAFGLHTGWTYGWFRPKDSQAGMPAKQFRHLWHHHTSAIEFAYMMLQYHAFTGADIREYLPVIEGMVVWHDQFYRKQEKLRTGRELDGNGHLVFYPSSALEYAGGTKNPTNVIAGLRALTDGLLALPDGCLTGEKRAYYAAVREHLPPIPLKDSDGKKTIAVAISEDFGGNRMEFPQMYAVFPFDVYGLGRDGLDLARDTWAAGRPGQKFSRCWGYAGIITARLGLTDEAKRHCLESFLQRHPTRAPRFPAFWAIPADQTPDHDHGGSAMIGLQEMLMQTHGREIRLLPAWPKDWDVDFRLHAPYQTVVEGKVRGGRITSLTVTPRWRAAEVVIGSGR